MLRFLNIKNIALIDEVEIEFDAGMNVISGETGAGKSIIIDSINFLLGQKADKELIRHGQDMAFVEGCFDISDNDGTKTKLTEFGFSAEDNLIISRTMSKSLKSDIRINGKMATNSVLKEITRTIVDVFGQSEHQSLSKVSTHIDLIDKFDSNILPLKEEVAKKYAELKNIDKEIGTLGGSDQERERTLELLSYQLEEIEKANLSEIEEEELQEKRTVFLNFEKIYENLTMVVSLIDGEDNGALSGISLAKNYLNVISDLNDSIGSLSERLDNVKIEISDINDTVRSMLDNMQYDEEEAQRVEERLDLYKSLKRKYGPTVKDILNFYNKNIEIFNKLKNGAEELERLNAKRKNVLNSLVDSSDKLSSERRESALQFETAVLKELSDLGMKGCHLKVDFAELTDKEKALSKNGYDKVEFMFSANVGEPLKPLVKVISGGEMSRFMLALKSITCDIDDISVMIFDEIDTGISGKMATIVGQKFKVISKKRQLIIITHLPQIAAGGDLNFLIEKTSTNLSTSTKLLKLSKNEKIKEIARLAGGNVDSEISIKHAEELIREANS